MTFKKRSDQNRGMRGLRGPQVSEEVVSSAGDADLVILEGMGRAIETNLHAQFSVDAVKLGMIKHKEARPAAAASLLQTLHPEWHSCRGQKVVVDLQVAQMLGGRLYDCVCKLSPGVPAAGS